MRRTALVFLLVCAGVARAATYTTYIGDTNQYQVSAIATDASGNTYVTGSRTISQTSDVFVAKVDNSGTLTLLGTFSGKGADQANGIAVDPAGNIYIVGNTTSIDFPLHNALQSIAYGSTGGTGFLVKMSGDGTVIYATYLGGTQGFSALNGVAVDADGNAYVTGSTMAKDYEHTQGMPAGSVYPNEALGGISGAFFAKVNASGGQILYAGAVSATNHDCGEGSTCFLSPIYTSGLAIAVDAAGNAYIAGNSGGLGLPSTPGVLLAGGIGAFVAKIDAAGDGLAYLTYLGAANYIPGVASSSNPGNMLSAITVDAAGNAYIAGATSDPAFPATAGAFQTALAGPAGNPFEGPPADAFVAKLNPTGTAMVWATFLGGSDADVARSINADAEGNVWISGTTHSTDFPTTVSVAPGGGEFVAELNDTGTKLLYSAVFPANTVAQALTVNASDTVHVAGGTGLVSAFTASVAPGETTAPWMFGITNAAGGVLSGRLAPGELISIYGLHIGPASAATLGGVQVEIDGIVAPLLYVSETQINAIAPVELTAGAPAELLVTQGTAPVQRFRTMVDAAAPQIFQNPQGIAAAVNQDGTINSQTNPAPVGSYVSIWATGTGYFPGSDGALATSANQFCSLVGDCQLLETDGNAVNVTYFGAAPDLVNGVVQINFQVVCAACGYYLSVDGVNSDTVSIYTAP